MFFIFPESVISVQNPDSSDEVAAEEKKSAEKPAEVKISGMLREDAYYIRMPDIPTLNSGRRNLFANTLEARLILDRTREDWSFYADGRLYLYAGEFKTAYGLTRFNLMRAFARYFSRIGDFTLGKTYVNFGNSGIFNPFEIDKNFQLTDIQYARSGIYAFEYYLPWQDLGGLKVYAGFNDSFDYNPMAGISPSFHLGKFDIGAVFNHSDIDKNIAGLYFKGDAILGVQGSWGIRMDDKFKYSHSEVSAGIDYSFFDGKIITSLLFYYNGSGADDVKNYKSSPDSFFLAKYYGFLSFAWIIDEFWNIKTNIFMNFIDTSALIMPGVTVVIANGLSLNLQVLFVTMQSDAEFSRDKSGDVTALIRVEGKF